MNLKNNLSAKSATLQPTRLTRTGSLVVKVSAPYSLKRALEEIANDRDCFKGSVNAFVRDCLRSRYHRPNIPEPDPHDRRVRLTLRLTPEEWDDLRCYAKAWKMPIWRAIYLLASRPYTVFDRKPTQPHTKSHTKEKDIEEDRKSVYVCNRLSKPHNSQIFPVNGLAEKLWLDFGVTLKVANDVVSRYGHEEIQAAIELRSQKNGCVYNPAGFILHLLKHGYAKRYAEAKHSNPPPKPTTYEPDYEPAYYRKWCDVKKEIYGDEEIQPFLPSSTFAKATMPSETETDDELICARCGKTDRETPIDMETHLCLECSGHQTQCCDCGSKGGVYNEVRYRELFDAILCRKCFLSKLKNFASPTDSQTVSFEEGEKSDETVVGDTLASENDKPESDFNPFERYPFAAPTSLLPPRRLQDRAERAAEIAVGSQSFSWFGQPKTKRKCPRCGRESFELKLRRYQRQFRQIPDAEAEKWDGVEVCCDGVGSCWDSLAKGEIAAYKRAWNISDFPDLPLSQYAETSIESSALGFPSTQNAKEGESLWS